MRLSHCKLGTVTCSGCNALIHIEPAGCLLEKTIAAECEAMERTVQYEHFALSRKAYGAQRERHDVPRSSSQA